MNADSGHAISAHGSTFTVYEVGHARPQQPHLIWGHGWGQSAASLLPLAESVRMRAYSTLVDFPGFGSSPPPPINWGTADYADLLVEWLRHLPPAPRIWIGHSFGCRIGLQIAARAPDVLNALVLIAAPGVPYRTTAQRGRLWVKIRTYKMLKYLFPEGAARNFLRRRFGSADYRNSEHLRGLLTRVVNEDLSTIAKQVHCSTLLIYGEDDRDTPARIGTRYTELLPYSKLVVLRGFDHHNILSEGRHQVLYQLQNFMGALAV